MLIPIEQQELDYYKAMLQKTYEVRKLLNDKKVPLQKKVIMIKEILKSDANIRMTYEWYK